MAEAYHTGHRARLRQRFLNDCGDAMDDYEVLEIALFGALPRGDTKIVANTLLERFGTLEGVVTAPPAALRRETGVGDAVVAALKVIEAAAVRMARGRIVSKPVIGCWEALVSYSRTRLSFLETEEFHVLYLDKKNRLISDERQGRGTIDHTPVYPREVIKRALELNASAMVLVHNHPSGDPTPSRADVEITEKSVRVAEAVGISVHDHLIIGAQENVSLRAEGLLAL